MVVPSPQGWASLVPRDRLRSVPDGAGRGGPLPAGREGAVPFSLKSGALTRPGTVPVGPTSRGRSWAHHHGARDGPVPTGLGRSRMGTWGRGWSRPPQGWGGPLPRCRGGCVPMRPGRTREPRVRGRPVPGLPGLPRPDDAGTVRFTLPTVPGHL